jgi:hypothetical protein
MSLRTKLATISPEERRGVVGVNPLKGLGNETASLLEGCSAVATRSYFIPSDSIAFDGLGVQQ